VKRKRIWENPAGIFSLTVVKSCEAIAESLQDGTEAVGEGVFSSALRKFKSPILGGKRAL
tara:strand:- start:669 stop:848 length:180 start_codon:yes stop_codon:yes gene_type:complete